MSCINRLSLRIFVHHLAAIQISPFVRKLVGKEDPLVGEIF